MESGENVIRIGTSPMTPAQPLVDSWPKLQKQCPDIKFQLVPFVNTPENAREILKNLGQNIDVIAGIFDETMLRIRQCAGLEMSREPICCAVSIHPLLKILPVDWKHMIPFGLLHSPEPSKTVRQFLDAVKAVM